MKTEDHRISWLALLATTAALSLGLAGCREDNRRPDNSPPPPSPTTGAVNPDPGPPLTPPGAGGDLTGFGTSGELAGSVQRALSQDPGLSAVANNITVTMENDRLVLRGTVPSHELRALAEQRARIAAMTTQVDNQIMVSEPSTRQP